LQFIFEFILNQGDHYVHQNTLSVGNIPLWTGGQRGKGGYHMNNVSPEKTLGKSLWMFFILTFALSWAFWIPMAASGKEVSLGLLVIGAFSPSVFGILMTYRSADKAGRADFWRRTIHFGRIGSVWYAVIGLLFPAIMALTFVLDSVLGGEIPSLEGALQTLTQPFSLLVFIITMLIGGPLAEELGWRGFALDRLQSKWTALRASLVLGGIHAAWHLPLFFTIGTSQGSMGFATSLFWLWVVQVVAGTIFFTWVYNNNRRSILSAVLIHFMSNSTFTIIAQLGGTLPLRIEIIRTAITVALAAIIVIVWGPTTMSKLPRARPSSNTT
jgi:membrane protease YdiL (CAAX protease family)